MVFRERLPDGSVLLTGQIPPTMDEIKTELINLLHPVNSLYFTVNNVNPGTRLTGTTWIAWGSGMVPVGVNAADSSFDVPEKVGGEKAHVLTIEELASHRHGQGGHTWSWGAGGNVYTSGAQAAGGGAPSNNLHTYQGANDWANTMTQGNNWAHNNLQPYITCYMWKRTA